MKLILFGAGKIGRSFIGQLFSRAGYKVVFVDKDERLIEALNRQHSYKLKICAMPIIFFMMNWPNICLPHIL